MADTAHALHELEVAMEHVFVSKAVSIAGFCILCYDHLLTFSDEVQFIWKQKRSLVSTFFLLNRYITPLVLMVDVYDKGGLTSFIPTSFCVGWYYAESVWNLIAFALVHAIVALRVHAIWGRPRWLSYTLSACFAVYFIVTTVVTFKLLVDYAGTLSYNPLFRVCFAEISPFLWACWFPALVFESLLFILTVIKAVEHSRNNINTPVLFVLYRDGIIYFVVICCCSLFNMLVWIIAPPTLVALSKYFVFCVVPTMGSRLVLNLRSSRREDVMPTGRSTTDDTGYEMHPKVVSHKASGDRFNVSSYGPDGMPIHERDHLSLQDRIQLNQIRASKIGGREGRWNVV